MKSLSQLVQDQYDQEKQERERLAAGYQQSAVFLDQMFLELEELIKNDRKPRGYTPAVKRSRYGGANHYPSRPWLEVYVPYQGEGSFKILADVYGSGGVTIEVLNGRIEFGPTQLDQAVVAIARLYSNL